MTDAGSVAYCADVGTGFGGDGTLCRFRRYVVPPSPSLSTRSKIHPRSTPSYLFLVVLYSHPATSSVVKHPANSRLLAPTINDCLRLLFIILLVHGFAFHSLQPEIQARVTRKNH